MDKEREQEKKPSSLYEVIVHAIIIRFFILVFGIAIQYIIEPYDKSNVQTSTTFKNNISAQIYHAIKGFKSWDAVYFIEIAQRGYAYENIHAFFPMLPILIHCLMRMASIVLPFIDQEVMAILIGIGISNTSFILSIGILYKLTRIVFKSRDFAKLAAQSMALSPAGIFLSVPYTESLFSLFAMTGMYLWEIHSIWGTSIVFSMAVATRGNGIVLGGFFVYGWMKYSRRPFQFVTTVIFPLMIMVIPYCLFQYMGYLFYCTPEYNRYLSLLNDKEIEGFLQGNHPWCLGRIPNLYGYVQAAYWNNGIFHYWTLQQLPNFLLAGPIIVIVVVGLKRYLSHRQGIHLWNLGMGKDTTDSTPTLSSLLDNPRLLVYGVYTAFLLSTILVFGHVQILTRFLSHIPAVYWIMASIYRFSPSPFPRLLFGYSLMYTIVGTYLFVLFYPWT